MEKIVIQKLPELTEAARAALAPLMGDFDFAGEIVAGRCELWSINRGQSWLITEIDGSELEICCITGRHVKTLIQWLHQSAKKRGLKTARMFTDRESVVKLYRRWGYHFSPVGQRGEETEYRMTL
ncbi:hypothetical protein [Endozoicomonas arenosclerae]|uniref:hypothetical protein n=1 Tax=Endozoicomonas arenosclerae TaxID=1633495 RepID=UPI0007864594|nr:hypothetical protein [Endozoicomonas arenosclerae]